MGPGQWNGADARAAVPTPCTLEQGEVLLALPHLVIASPGALCLGVYAGDCALPLHFVPPSFAEEKDIPHGWYLCARAGVQFSLRVTPTPACISACKRFGIDTLIAFIRVDGMDANPRGRTIYPHSLNEYVLPGFVEQQQTDARGSVTKRFRAFEFARAHVQEGYIVDKGQGEQAESACIQLRVKGACRGEKVALSDSKSQYRQSDVRPVCEQDAKRLGTSLCVSREGRSVEVVRRCKKNIYVLNGIRDVPQFDITIHVREEFWLRSRGIIDDSFESAFPEMTVHCTHSDEVQRNGPSAEVRTQDTANSVSATRVTRRMDEDGWSNTRSNVQSSPSSNARSEARRHSMDEEEQVYDADSNTQQRNDSENTNKTFDEKKTRHGRSRNTSMDDAEQIETGSRCSASLRVSGGIQRDRAAQGTAMRRRVAVREAAVQARRRLFSASNEKGIRDYIDLT